MITIAITGGIGSGKSTVLKWFEAQSIPTINADLVARQVVEKGQPGLTAITEHFNKHEIINEQGTLDRVALRHIIFNDTQAKTTLENILHPLIRAEIQSQLATLKQNQTAICAIEIPLLTETGKPDYIDQVWVVDCQAETQIQRAMVRSQQQVNQKDQESRPTLSRQEVEKIIASQASREERKEISDVLINSDLSLNEMYNQLDKALQNIRTLHTAP